MCIVGRKKIFSFQDAFKKRFSDAVEQSNAQIFTEDLRTAILSANTDQEIDYIIKGLKK